MAYMNFNTDTKFWSRLTVQSFATIPGAYDKGCIAFHDTSNNGMMSVAGATEGTYEWKPIVHTVEAGTGTSDSGEVTQNGGHVVITFPKSSGGSGNCSKKTIVCNVNASQASPISQLVVVLPDAFNYTSSFLMTTVYTINSKGVIMATLTPKVEVVEIEDNGATINGVKFTFQNQSITEKLKIMILFDQIADEDEPDVYTDTTNEWSTQTTDSEINTRTPADIVKNPGA